MKLLFILLMLTFSKAVFCQSGLGTMVGSVRNKRSEPINTATLKLYLWNNRLITEIHVDSNGRCQIDNLLPGEYTVVVETDSREYQFYKDSHILIHADKPTFYEAILLPVKKDKKLNGKHN